MNTISEERLAANRANAQKSTGPKTPEGRANSKMNALKHGFLSKEVLVQSIHRKENEDELTALHERFMDELAPVGPAEEMLVDQIVTTHWRLRRLLAVESGAIVTSIDEGVQARVENLQLRAMKATILGQDPILQIVHTAMGFASQRHYLEKVRAAVEQEGELNEAILKRLDSPIVHYFMDLSEHLQNLCLKLPEGLPPAEVASYREEAKAKALNYLDGRSRSAAFMEKRYEEQERITALAQQAAAALPKPEIMDRIIRYESMLNRQLFRAMKELRTLQKERREGGQGEGSAVNLRNEPIDASEASEISDLRSQISGKLPNEPILASHPSQISHLSPQTT